MDTCTCGGFNSLLLLFPGEYITDALHSYFVGEHFSELVEFFPHLIPQIWQIAGTQTTHDQEHNLVPMLMAIGSCLSTFWITCVTENMYVGVFAISGSKCMNNVGTKTIYKISLIKVPTVYPAVTLTFKKDLATLIQRL